MALSRVKIANFKSLREIEIDLPTDLVALVGRNNSGKSALLDAILLAAATTRPATQARLFMNRGWRSGESPTIVRPPRVQLRVGRTPSSRRV